MGVFSRVFGRRDVKTSTPLPRENPREAFKITDEMLAWARGLARKDVHQAKPDSIFRIAERPPGVGPKDAKIAMDSGIAEAQSWAANQVLSGFWTEGITFLGYAYLSELAQRPEYRVISETIATEMTRKWIRFTSKGDGNKSDKIAALVAEFDRLNVRDLFCRAAQQDGFFGRGHIYIDTGDTDDTDELQKTIGDGWNKISKTKISSKKPVVSLRTVEAVWCYPTSYNSNDPLKDNWYRPDSWYVQAKIVHSSRLLTLIGREVPDLLKPTYSFGGLSLSQMAKPYVDNWLQTRQGVNDIINAFSVFVLSSNLQQSLEGDGQQLFKRAEIFNLLRSNAGLMMLDKESEDFKNVSANIAGLEGLQAQAQEHMASVSHIPTVKLLGIQPAGLNADSEGVMRSFYDYVNAYQDHLFRKPLHRLLGYVMLSLWGELDEDITFEFEPLWALSEKEQAEVDKIESETAHIRIDSGVISQQEERTRIASKTDTPYDGLDPDDMPDLLDEEEEGLEPLGGRPDPALVEGAEKGKNALDRMFDAAKEAA